MTTTIDPRRLARTGTLGPLSESIIPAVPGEFYAYPSIFTDGKPLYALMKCKATKARILGHAGELAREVHLHFGFESATRARVSSIKTAQAAGLLGPVNAEFDDVWVAPAQIAIEDFYVLCAQRDSTKLAEVCKASCSERVTSMNVVPDLIVAVLTSAGKHGLFLVKELTPASVDIDACHVLL